MTESFSCRYFWGTFLSFTILAIVVVQIFSLFFFHRYMHRFFWETIFFVPLDTAIVHGA